MADKIKINNNYSNVLLLQFLVIAMLITRLLNIIVPHENLFFMQEYSDISLLTLFTITFLFMQSKQMFTRITIQHLLVFAMFGMHIKFFVFDESLIKWFAILLFLLASLVFFIQNFIARKSLSWFVIFFIVNSLAIVWLFIDVETFTVVKTHFSLKYLLEFVRLKQLFAEAAFNIGKTSQTLILSLLYLLVLPFLPVLLRNTVESKINVKKYFLFVSVLGVVLIVHYVGFNYCCSRVKLCDYLPIRLNLGVLPIPDHTILRSNDKLKRVLETNYFVDNLSAYSEPKIAKENDFNGYNIVFIAIESLRFDAYREHMSELNKVGSKGIQMFDNYSLSNITMSSLFSLFNSNYPINLSFTTKADRKSNFEKFLEQAGYDTNFVGFAPGASFQGQSTVEIKLSKNHENAPKVLAKTLSLLKSNKRCFVLSYIFNTHFNYYYPPAFETNLPVINENENPLFIRPTRENMIKVRNRYANAVSYVDHCLGNFFSEVFRHGIDKETIFVIFGDHGESLGEAGFFAHATGPHKAQFRVPLIILGGPIQPTMIDWPTSHIDIIPTLARYLNFKLENYHGLSVLKQRDYPIINFDESVSGRIIVRRKKSMSLFDIDHNMKLKWLGTLNNDYTLTADILKLYQLDGFDQLADRIEKDAKFIVKTLKGSSI